MKSKRNCLNPGDGSEPVYVPVPQISLNYQDDATSPNWIVTKAAMNFTAFTLDNEKNGLKVKGQRQKAEPIR